jgi:hypothetical protein
VQSENKLQHRHHHLNQYYLQHKLQSELQASATASHRVYLSTSTPAQSQGVTDKVGGNFVSPLLSAQ